MTEEFGLNGLIDCENRTRVMNGENTQSRVARYKEERRKQLASQFNNLSRNLGDTSSSSSAANSGLKKASFRPSNSNSIKDEDVRKAKLQTNYKNPNKVRYRLPQEDSTESKSKTNSSITSDSAATSSSKSNRDKSAKRKSYLNRSANAEKTSNTCRNVNRHLNHCTDERGAANKCYANTIADSSSSNSTSSSSSSSLPCAVVVNSSASTSTPSFVSSQKTMPTSSPSHTIKSTAIDVNSQINSYSYSHSHSHLVGNGFAHSNSMENSVSKSPNDTSHSSNSLCDSTVKSTDKETSDKSKIPRRIHSSSVLSSRFHNQPQPCNTNCRCEDVPSEFRLQQVETIILKNCISDMRFLENTSDNEHSLINDYDVKNHSIDEIIALSSSSSSSSSSLSNIRNRNFNNDDNDHDHGYGRHDNNDDDHHDSNCNKDESTPQKNSLLEIVQNFSDTSNNVENYAPNNTAETDCARRNSAIYYACSSSPQNSSLEIIEEDSPVKPSILKKKFDERSNSLDLPRPSSILKRKTSDDADHHHVFTAANSKQGILKKHSSLDEQDVRRRSCSPDVDIGRQLEFKPILKSQRRSSLEELVRHRSPELHSILKRSKVCSEDALVDRCASPHGILKRKISLSNSSGGVAVATVTNVVAATAAAAAAAAAAESFSSSNSSTDSPVKNCHEDAMVKPILKNKQHSFELPVAWKCTSDTPRPILKKKHSVETDTDDERPKKPILKSTSRSLDEDDVENGVLAAATELADSAAIKPILKNKQALFRQSRNAKSDDDASKQCIKARRDSNKRNSLPASSKHFSAFCPSRMHGENSLSVAERVQNLESLRVEDNPVQKETTSANDPSSRNLRFSRNVERYKTQPITCREIFSTRSAMERQNQKHTPQYDMAVATKPKSKPKPQPQPKDGDESDETSRDDARKRADNYDEGEFRQNGNVLDDNAVISNLKRSNSVSMKASLFSKWQNSGVQPSEAVVKPKKNEKNSGHGRKLKIKCSDLASRFSTQPVTFEEVAEAKKQNLKNRANIQETIRMEVLQNVPENDEDKADPSLMSFSERIKLFACKMDQRKETPKKCPKRLGCRYNTQPVTNEELRCAKNANFRNSGADQSNDVDVDVASSKSSNRRNSDAEKKFSPATNELESESLNVSAYFERLQVHSDSPSPQDVTISNLVDTDVSPNNDIDRLFDKIYLENSSETGSQSEGDTSSSGGREVQRIIGSKQSYLDKREKTIEIAKMNVCPVRSTTATTTATDVVDDCPSVNGNSSIAQRLAALQRSGQVDWKKRISRIVPENELPPIININETQELLKKELTNGFRCKVSAETYAEEKKDSSLAERLEKLENASQTWKKRVEPSDAAQFSVAGKMASSTSTATVLVSAVTSPLSERKKRTPCPSRFKSFREKNAARSTPISPEKSKSTTAVFGRSLSLPSSDANDSGGENENENETGTENRNNENNVVSVPQICDEDFYTFFGSMDTLSVTREAVEFISDLDDIKVEKPQLILGLKKIRAQRKHATSGNPLKMLSSRLEIKNEYREVKTNVAEKELKRMNVEKLSKSSNLAIEVLAGLASKEDFSAVHLRKAATPISVPLLPYKPLMLLHVKGRRHVQTRLVEPIPQSINSGDCYVLVTSKEVYHWIGEFCNIIEKSRGAEIAQHIFTTHDLGCSGASQVNTIVEDVCKPNSKAAQSFWMLLGVQTDQAASFKAARSGHPDEDEIYENQLISTNMIFEVVENELVPCEKYWASVPKIQMLDPHKVFVFDFGSEMYVWMGKNVDLKLRKSSAKLAEELWNNGYNYEECDLCPITSVATIGERTVEENETFKKNSTRPEWCLIAKVTQHMETVLFREKFLDWPDFSRVIRAKGKDEDMEKQIDGSLDIKPCNVKEMLAVKATEPDLILEGGHLGRGTRYFDEERRKFCMVSTSDVKVWHVSEFESEELPQESLGQFYSTDSYVVRWIYSISYTGRELSGQPSKHTVTGRERCVYFCWQGKNASLNEQGAAALLTVELDKEKGIQLRICQGYEPPAFFNLFNGHTVIYKNRDVENSKLFVCRGETDSEACLLQVSCNVKQLRSRASFVLMHCSTGTMYVWHGRKVSKAASQACSYIASNLKNKRPAELAVKSDVTIDIVHVKEGEEPKEFFAGLGSCSAKLYLSLSEQDGQYDYTPLLYHLSSNSGTFCASPIWSPCRHSHLVTAYPFLQDDLYSASQPALFLLDTGKTLWLWQGWWPERKVFQEESSRGGDEISQNSENFRGSATVRWQLERRAAMQTALDYWKLKYEREPVEAFLVWAGLEPIQFTNLFPDWHDRDDIAEMNILDGRKPGEVLHVERELARLTQSTYPIEQLLQRPLPDGVDPTKLELYLSDQHFKEILKVTKEEFSTLPSWKQTNLKKNAGLF